MKNNNLEELRRGQEDRNEIGKQKESIQEVAPGDEGRIGAPSKEITQGAALGEGSSPFWYLEDTLNLI